MIMTVKQSTIDNPCNFGTCNTYNPLRVECNTDYGLSTNTGYSLNQKINMLEDWIKDLEGRKFEFIELSCKNCGAKIQQKYSDPIMKCPYCKTVYAIGTKQVNSI